MDNQTNNSMNSDNPKNQTRRNDFGFNNWSNSNNSKNRENYWELKNDIQLIVNHSLAIAFAIFHLQMLERNIHLLIIILADSNQVSISEAT